MAKKIEAAKAGRREKYRSLRNKLPAAYRKSAARRIAAALQDVPEFGRARCVGIYLGKGTEVATAPILKKILALGKTAAAPRTDFKSRRLEFFKITGLKDCRPGAYAIREPKPGCARVNPAKIGLLLVPGIVFDRRGYRLGYGQGFYDRFLQKHPRLATIGLSYAKTLVKSLPKDRFDRPVRLILTERGLLRRGNVKK